MSLEEGEENPIRQLNRIQRIIEKLKRDEVAVWADEVDGHLNPKIGPDWMLPGQQRQIVMPGQNRKRYIAGALHAKTRRLTWVVGERKNCQLFIPLVLKLCEEDLEGSARQRDSESSTQEDAVADAFDDSLPSDLQSHTQATEPQEGGRMTTNVRISREII